MAADTQSIKITCPVEDCNAKSSIDVPSYLLDKNKFGTIKVQIKAGDCCKHEFIAFIDRKGKIRSIELIDMSINLHMFRPDADKKEDSKIFLSNLLDKYSVYGVSNILHALLIDLDIYLISSAQKDQTENDRFTYKVNSLLKSLLPKNYHKDLLVFSMTQEEYKKSGTKEALILTPNSIADNPWKQTQFENEKEILTKSGIILDQAAQSYIIQHEIEKIFEKVDFVKDLISLTKEDIFEDELKEMIQKKNPGTRDISDDDIVLFKQILQYRYKISTDNIKIRSFSKLSTGLW